MSSTSQQQYDVAAERSEGASGWVLFAGVIMLVDGILDACWGLAAILNDEVVTVGGHGVVLWDFTAWGWGHLIGGSLVALTGVGLLAARGWARWLGVLFVSINVILQFGIFTAFPLWAMLVIALDVIVLYQLTVRWEPANRV